MIEVKDLDALMFYWPSISEMMKIVEAYPITMEELARLARIAAIIDTERSPGYTYKHLCKHYVKYHQGEL